MVSLAQKKGVMIGITWSLLAWVPYYTNYLSNIRGILGIPATLGLNLELALGKGDAFIYSLLLGTGLGFFSMTMVEVISKNIRIIGLIPARRRRLLRRGL